MVIESVIILIGLSLAGSETKHFFLLKQRDIVLSQDNALTTARYKFDLIEKRALYSIIRNIRSQYIENENGRRDLFDDLIITIYEEELKKMR